MRIVRRLTHSIRKHDWFFVVVDIVVLVLGLVLAFQVDRWWVEQRERRRCGASPTQLLGCAAREHTPK